MKIFHPKSHIVLFHKKRRLNTHRIWEVFCITFIGSVLALLGCLSWYFLDTTHTLDEPVTANLQTNAGKISDMQQALDAAEAAVQARIGTKSSQNTSSVVQ